MTSWPTTRLRYVADLNPRIPAELATDADRTVSFVPMEGVGEDGRLSLESTKTVEEAKAGYSYFADGDVLMAKVTPCFENGKSAIAQGLLGGQGFGTTELTVLRPRPEATSPRYLHYFLQSEAFRQEGTASMLGAGGLKRIPDVFVRDFKCAWPPLGEQERIANFLDEKTARIDALIAEKRRLIDLVNQTVWNEVSQAVSLGIAGAPTKRTDMDWCPVTPKHWEVLLLRRLFVRMEYGLSESMNPNGAIGVIRMGNVGDGRVDTSDLKFVDHAPAELLLKDGDLLYNRTNSLAQVAKVGLLKQSSGLPLTFASYLVRLVPNERACPAYLNYLLNSPDVLAIARSLALPSIGQANLNPSRYGYIRVPLPPVGEQREIVEHLDTRRGELDLLSVHAAQHVELLQEYRSSLISAGVTGTLSVS